MRFSRDAGRPMATTLAADGAARKVAGWHCGYRRRATTYLQPEDGFEPWAPQPGYFRVLWRAYARLGFDVAPLATAAGVEP